MSGGTPIDSLPEYDPSMISTPMEEEFSSEMAAPAPRAQGRQFQGPSVEARGMMRGGRRRRESFMASSGSGSGDFGGGGGTDWKNIILTEGKLPLVAAVLYFILNMDFVDVQLLKYIPKLFNREYELNTNGIIFKAALMGVVLLLVNHFMP